MTEWMDKLKLPLPLEEIQEHIKPQHDRVIVLREPDPTQTKSGLHLPAGAQEFEMTNLRPGVVVAVGPGRWDPHGNVRCPMELEVGDRVMFHKNAGEKIYCWGQCFQQMGDGDIGSVIRSDTPVEMVYAQIAARG